MYTVYSSNFDFEQVKGLLPVFISILYFIS
jgi:hypothetical protein